MQSFFATQRIGPVVLLQIVCSATYTIWSVTCLGYHVLAVCVEVNTAFLHLRKLLQLAAVPRSNRLLQLNRYLNLASFLLFRFGPLLLLTAAIRSDGARLPAWFLTQFAVSMLTLNAVNAILFYRLLRADVWNAFRAPGAASASASATARGHKKIDSTAGVCGSLQVVEDWNGTGAGADAAATVSRTPSSSDCANLVISPSTHNLLDYQNQPRTS